MIRVTAIDRQNVSGQSRRGMEKCARVFMRVNKEIMKGAFFNLKRRRQNVILDRFYLGRVVSRSNYHTSTGPFGTGICWR